MTTIPPTAFADAVRSLDLDALAASFADDVELASPVLAEPFVGKPTVTRLFHVLADVLDDIEIRHDLAERDVAVLHFTATVESTPIEIVDVVTFDEVGLIRTITVTSRPLDGTESLAGAVAPHLPEILGA